MKRRSFLKAGSAATVAFGAYKAQALAESPLLGALRRRGNANDHILVIIQLNGGNDGLNTLIPLDQYNNLSKARTTVLIPDTKVAALKGYSGTGIHPSLTGLKNLFDSGLVSAVQAVGYPQPNFSHFRSTDIWMSGSDSNQTWATGWMGRYLDQRFPGFPDDYPSADMPDPLGIQIGNAVSMTFMGPNANMGMVLSSVDAFYDLVAGGDSSGSTPSTPAEEELAYLRMLASQTNAFTDVVKAAASKGKNLSTKYPGGNNLADQLKIVAKLINGGLKTPVYMVSLGGFDTHAQQVDTSDTSKGSHANLMKTLGDAIAAFQDDLQLLGHADRVAGMTFSEFGRRIKDNASNGTDHGAAAPLFVFGTGVQSGIIGKNPEIASTVTVNDNVPMQFDFRQVYASVLQDWFELSASEVKAAMGDKDFDTLPIFKSNPAGLDDYLDLVSRISLSEPYPNPAGDSAQIRLNSDGGNVRLELFDALGRQVRVLYQARVAPGEMVVDIDLQGLPSGNYVLQLAQGPKRESRILTKR